MSYLPTGSFSARKPSAPRRTSGSYHARVRSEVMDPFAEAAESDDEADQPSASPPAASSSSAAAAPTASASPVPRSSPPPRVAPSSAPLLSGQAHLLSLLQSLGKRPLSMQRDIGSSSGASVPVARSAPSSASSAVSSAASAAFDRLVHADVSATRASYIASLAHSSRDFRDNPFALPDDSAPGTIASASPPLFGAAAMRKTPTASLGAARAHSPAPTAASTAAASVAKSVRSSPRRSPSSPATRERPEPPPSSLGATAAATAAQKPFLPRALSSSFAESKTSSNAAAAASSRTAASRPAAATTAARPAPASRKSSSTRSSPVPAAAASASPSFSRLSSATSRKSALTPVRSDSDNDRMEDDLEHAATQTADDDDDESESEGFTFSADGPVARELAAQAAEKAKRAAEEAAQAEQARFKAAIRKREQAERARLEAKKRKREEEARLAEQNGASSAAAVTSGASPALPSSLPAAKRPLPSKLFTPSKPRVAITDDPFADLFDEPEPSQAAQPASQLPPPQPHVSARATSTLTAPRQLPAHIAVALGSSRLPVATPKRASPPPPLPSSAPKLDRAPSGPAASELLLMRTANLALKSNSSLLLEALLGKTSVELREVEEQALTPMQRFALQRKAEIAAAAAASGGATEPSPITTFASLLAAKTGRKLKAKQGEGVGHNAKQRNRARRTDGFLADMTPTLERTVEYLLANGADPNTEDADRNRPLWIALQIRGSDRVVQMLLDKGAECVEALESEDESSSDDEPDALGMPSMRAANAALDRQQEEQENTARSAILGLPMPMVPFKPQAAPQLSVRALRKAGAHPSLPKTLRELQAASGGAGDVFNFERGSTVDLAMKLGSQRQTMLLLRAGHLPHRNGRVRLLDFARLHGFGDFAFNFLRSHLHAAIREGDEAKALDMIRHMDKKALDGRDQTGRTALYVAVESKDPLLPIVECLLRSGANPNQPDISMTPMAVFPLCRGAKKSTTVLALLVKHGLDPSQPVGDSGQTLLEFAIEAAARPESIELLQEAAKHKRGTEAKRATGSGGSSSSKNSSPAHGPMRATHEEPHSQPIL